MRDTQGTTSNLVQVVAQIAMASKQQAQISNDLRERAGTIQISTRGNINVDGKNFVEIIVADDGPGVPDNVMEQLFHPVKKYNGKHYSGLGLAIVKDLVSDLHGSISCRSTKDVGTEFRVYIPH